LALSILGHIVGRDELPQRTDDLVARPASLEVQTAVGRIASGALLGAVVGNATTPPRSALPLSGPLRSHLHHACDVRDYNGNY
jgi:hypothetical protein